MVDGQLELGRDVKDFDAEHVDDERVDGGGTRAEEVAERRVHGAEAAEKSGALTCGSTSATDRQ